ncbi:MAG: AI-2E family transporter [Acidimicrobiales bacterium]
MHGLTKRRNYRGDVVDHGLEPAPDDRMPRWVPRAILLFFGAFGTLYALFWLLQRLEPLLILILVSLFLSFAIEPAVNRLERLGVRRGIGTLLVFAVIGVALAGFGWAIGSLLADQVDEFVGDAPGYIEDIEIWANDSLGIELDTDDLIREFQEGGAAATLATRLAGDLVGLGTTALNLLLQIFTIALFTFYMVADGPRLRRSICSLLPPERQMTVLRIWDLAIEKTGGYIYSRTILAIASFIFHWIAFVIIGIPFPLPLALWVGVMSQFIPVVGTYIAGALPILIALLDDPITALWVFIAVFAYQQLENYVFAPPITAHTMELHPAVAFGAVIGGAAVLGVVGALLALPAAAVFQAFTSTYLHERGLVHEVAPETGLAAPTHADDPDQPRRRWYRRG